MARTFQLADQCGGLVGQANDGQLTTLDRGFLKVRAVWQAFGQFVHDLDNRRSCVALLLQIGGTLHGVDQALALLGSDSAGFDLVFTDVVMPGMSGIELGLEVRRRYPGLPVVLTSGYNAVMASDGKYGFEMVLKPYTLDTLARAFDTALATAAEEAKA